MRYLSLFLFVGVAGPATAQVDALTMTYQGVLTDLRGQAIDGERSISFRLYEALGEGEPIWEERHVGVQVASGAFSVELGSVTRLPDDLGDRALFLGLQVDGDDEMTPRLKVGASLRARWAAVAAQALDVRGRDIHPSSVSIGERAVIDAAGRWVGETAGLRGLDGPRGPEGPPGERRVWAVYDEAGARMGELVATWQSQPFENNLGSRKYIYLVAGGDAVFSIVCEYANGRCQAAVADVVGYSQPDCQGTPFISASGLLFFDNDNIHIYVEQGVVGPTGNVYAMVGPWDVGGVTRTRSQRTAQGCANGDSSIGNGVAMRITGQLAEVPEPIGRLHIGP